MSKYTSTKAGFQEAMQWSLSGPSSEAKAYVEATTTTDFYQVMNDTHLDYSTYLAGIEEWRGKISDYHPVVHEFLRDGSQLAARMTGTIKVEGVDTVFESFMFASVGEDGRMTSLIERSVYGPAPTKAS